MRNDTNSRTAQTRPSKVCKSCRILIFRRCCKMNTWLQKSASIQPRTDLPKFELRTCPPEPGSNRRLCLQIALLAYTTTRLANPAVAVAIIKLRGVEISSPMFRFFGSCPNKIVNHRMEPFRIAFSLFLLWRGFLLCLRWR